MPLVRIIEMNESNQTVSEITIQVPRLNHQACNYGGATAYSELIQRLEIYEPKNTHVYRFAYIVDHTFSPIERTYVQAPFLLLRPVTK